MLEKFQKEGRAAFIPFVVAGDPSLVTTEKVVDALIEEGADLLELGVPFSDALADGPVIQAASERASKTITSIEPVLELAKRIETRHAGFPIILFTYYNPIFKMGVKEFAEKARDCGVAAVLVVDLPPEEAEGYCRHMHENGVRTVFLASPTTAPERLPAIARASTGFVYYVSRTGVTGVQKELSESLAEEMNRLRDLIQKPVAIGFGISNGPQASAVAKLGDAVVVGSAFVRLMTKFADDPVAMEREVRALARELVNAVGDGSKR